MATKQKETIIIGAGLTGLTTAFHLKRRGKDFQILECSDRTGGQIQTYNKDEFTFETGPNTGVISYPEVAELFDYIAEGCQMVTAREKAKVRYIWKGDRFRALPSGPLSAITTPLFTLKDKFRILGEPFRAKGTNPDESIGELVLRRLGKSFLQYAIDPFLSGVYSGDPMKLTTRYALPKLYSLEQDYGSFIRGAIAKSKIPKTQRDRLATKNIFSAKGGLSSLTKALTERIGSENITLSATGIKIMPSANNGWTVTYSTPNGEEATINAKHIITTVGAYCLPELLPFVEQEDMNKLNNLVYAPVVTISVGIKDTGDIHHNGFGGLVPSIEKRDVLGIFYTSACFEGIAPKGGALYTFFIGGMRHSDLTLLTDKELEALIIKELHEMLKFPKNIQPDMLQITRHKRAIPQYEVNSGERLATVEKLETQYPGLHIGGNLKDGIGMAHRILQGTELSKLI